MSELDKCWCGSGLSHSDCHMKIEQELVALKAKGEIIPPKRLIKNSVQIEGIRRAGKINSLVLDAASREIHAGMTTEEIDEIVMRETKALGGTAACLGYEGFPKAVCTSVNSVVCHGIPSSKQVLREGDIVNVDCTTIVDGYFGDASRMFIIGKTSPENEKLVRVTKECLEIAAANCKPYSHLGDIGYYVSKHARENRFSVVKEFGGHGIGLKMHEEPFVSHIGKLGAGMVLVPGMVFTIEPMINAGKADIFVDAGDGWTVYTKDGKNSAQWEHTFLMTESGLEILSW